MPLDVGYSHRTWMQRFQENPRGPWGTLNPNTLAPSTENTNTGLGMHTVEPGYQLRGLGVVREESGYGAPGYNAQIHNVSYYHPSPIEWQARLVQKNMYAQGMGPGLHGAPLGGVVEDVAFLTNQVITDPALPQVIFQVKRIIDAPSSGGPGGPITINLQDFVGPLEAIAWYRENPVWGKVALVGVAMLPVVVGYLIGRGVGSKKCKLKSQPALLGKPRRRKR